MSYLKINNLYQKRNKFTLLVDSLEIQKGSFFGVLGYSGAGKSSLLNLICGLEKHSSGTIFLDGKDISKLSPNKREIAYMFQNSLLFENLNVKENLEYILKAKAIKKENFSKIITKALSDCEAKELINRDVTTLSGGEKQRVALSMALMLKPKLLILDEPFSSLDSSLKVRMRAYLKSTLKKQNITTIMVTHDKEDAYELFDEMVLLDKGKVLQTGTPKNIYENPNLVECARYFGLENIFYGEIKDGYFSSGDLRLKIDSKEKKDIYIVIFNDAVKVSTDGTLEKITQATFIDGRWKYKLQSGIVFYLNEKFETEIKIKIDTTKLKIINKEEI